MNPEDVVPDTIEIAILETEERKSKGRNDPLWFPAHEVGEMLRDAILDAIESTEYVYESWHPPEVVAKSSQLTAAWLAKARELEDMK